MKRKPEPFSRKRFFANARKRYDAEVKAASKRATEAHQQKLKETQGQ